MKELPRHAKCNFHVYKPVLKKLRADNPYIFWSGIDLSKVSGADHALLSGMAAKLHLAEKQSSFADYKIEIDGKAYYTSDPAARILGEAMAEIASHGAEGVWSDFDRNSRLIRSALSCVGAF